MAELIAIVGESGSGKTTSIRNLNPEHTFLISTTGKRPGIKGANKKYQNFVISEGKATGNFFTSSSVDQIAKVLQIIDKKLLHITTVVIDDFQYIMGFEAMDRAKEKSYDKFTDMAQHVYQVLKTAMNMRDDLNIVVSTHSENIGDRMNPYHKMKTLGKMLDSVITLEGLFTYVLFTTVQRTDDNSLPSYKFITNSDGTCTAKSPMGLFDSIYIDNDLNYVVNRIKEYNEED
jgi:predicted kinase